MHTALTLADHVGITVADLDVATDFFVALGLEVEGRGFVEGEFPETVCGLAGVRSEIVMLKSPDGARLELAQFVRPDSVPGSPEAMPNELGLRNVAFEVDDIHAELARLKAAGVRLINETPTEGAHDMLIAFVHPSSFNGVLVELCQKKPVASGPEAAAGQADTSR